MNRNIYILAALLFNAMIFFSSCGGDSDKYQIDETWMRQNEKDFYAEAAKPEYKTIYGISDPYKYILWKESTFWSPSGSAISKDPELRQSMRSPVFSDTIKCRYEGWFKDANGNKVIFDSTDNPTSFNPTTDPNRQERSMMVGGLVDGWRVALYKMKEGDEWSLVIPFSLGYGMTRNNDIPACTNLYFDIKLIEIVSKSN